MEKHLDNLISILASAIRLPETADGKFRFRLLKSIATIESAYGQWNLPRFEEAWWNRFRHQDPVKYKRFESWVENFGRQVTSSFGPWQLMAFNAIDDGYPYGQPLSLLSLPEVSIPYVIKFINRQRYPVLVNHDDEKLSLARYYGEIVFGFTKTDLRNLQLINDDQVEVVLSIIGDVYNSGSTSGYYPVGYVKKLISVYHEITETI